MRGARLHGAAATGWVSVSSPLIDVMREEGCGLDSWMPPSNAVPQLACFVFVDDTDLADTLQDGNCDVEELIRNTQAALDY